MRPFSPRMFPHRATVAFLIEATGPAGGVAEAFDDPGPPLRCRVRYAADRAGMSAAAEVGVLAGQVAFPADPGVKLGDRIEAGGRRLRALGPAQPRDGDGALFVVEFESVN